mmetsp:Transcript_4089/g.7846  ORF Transcript_4089/g.7846 Transcript_4089/m.7846 type:complete len:919 (-) Transcript_4089:872-3628(-)
MCLTIFEEIEIKLQQCTQKIRVVQSLAGGADILFPMLAAASGAAAGAAGGGGGGARTTVAVKYYDAARIQRLDSLPSTQDARNRQQRQLRGLLLLDCSSSSSQSGAQQERQDYAAAAVAEKGEDQMLNEPAAREHINGRDDNDDGNEKKSSCKCWDYNFDNVKTFRDSYQHSVIFFVLPPSLLQSQLEQMDSIVNMIQRSCHHFSPPCCYCCSSALFGSSSNPKNHLAQSASTSISSSSSSAGCAKIFLLPDWNSALQTISSIQESLTASKIQKKESFFVKEAQRMLYPFTVGAPQEDQDDVNHSQTVEFDEACVKDVVRKVFREWAMRRGIDERDANIVLDVVGSLEKLIIGCSSLSAAATDWNISQYGSNDGANHVGRDILKRVPVEERVKSLIRSFFMSSPMSEEKNSCNAKGSTDEDNYHNFCDKVEILDSRPQSNTPQDSNHFLKNTNHNLEVASNLQSNYRRGSEMSTSLLGPRTNGEVVHRNHVGNLYGSASHNGRFDMSSVPGNRYGDVFPSSRNQSNGIYATVTGDQYQQSYSSSHNDIDRNGFELASSGQDFAVNTNQMPEMTIANYDYGYYDQPSFFMDDNVHHTTPDYTNGCWSRTGDNNGYVNNPWDQYQDENNISAADYRQQHHVNTMSETGDPRFNMMPSQHMNQRPSNGNPQVGMERRIGEYPRNIMKLNHQQSSPMLSPTPTVTKQPNSSSHRLQRGGGGVRGQRRYLRPAVSAECYRSPRVLRSNNNHGDNTHHSSSMMPTQAAYNTMATHVPTSGARRWQQQQSTNSINMPSSWRQQGTIRNTTPMRMLPRYAQDGTTTRSTSTPHHHHPGRTIVRSPLIPPTQQFYTRSAIPYNAQMMEQHGAFHENHHGHHDIVPSYVNDNPTAPTCEEYHHHGGVYVGSYSNGGNPFEEFSYCGYE